MGTPSRRFAAKLTEEFRSVRREESIVLLIAAVAAATELFVLIFQGAPFGGYVGLGLAACGLILCRRAPWPALALIAAGTIVDSLDWQPLVLWTVAVFVVFVVTRRGTLTVGAILLVAPAAYLAEVNADEDGWVNPTAFLAVAFTVAAAATGSALRNRRSYREAVIQRERDALVARENETTRRVVEERLRIARDLHDVVGHEIAGVSVQLGVAEVNLPPGSDGAREALLRARAGIQAVLLETQSILGVLRRGSDGSDDGLRPTPGLAGLPALIDSYGVIGLLVEDQIQLAGVSLDPEVETAAYRVVQEALTNAQRHGSGAARLEVSTLPSRLKVSVSNPVDSALGAYKMSDNTRGFGLIGMRERVASAGGSLTIDDLVDRFVVTATFDLDSGNLS